MTNTRVLDLTATPELAQQLGAKSLLVEATPLIGCAILVGVWRTWHEEDGVLVGDEEIAPITGWQQASLETLFAASMLAPEPTGPCPKAAGKGVPHTENRAGRYSYRKGKGR